WSEYISRLRSTCSISNKDDEDIISKLRRDVAQKVIQCIFYSTDCLSTITQRFQELEDTDKFEKNYRYKNYKDNNFNNLDTKSQYKYEKIRSSPNGETIEILGLLIRTLHLNCVLSVANLVILQDFVEIKTIAIWQTVNSMILI
ncbi:hypothetical protein DMUE_3073, partial [Dictyocoela muelleri]